MRISDWSSDVCSSDLLQPSDTTGAVGFLPGQEEGSRYVDAFLNSLNDIIWSMALVGLCLGLGLYFSIRTRFMQVWGVPEMLRLMFNNKSSSSGVSSFQALAVSLAGRVRSEEHTSELQSLMRNSYAVFCLQKKKQIDTLSNRNITSSTVILICIKSKFQKSFMSHHRT